MATLHERLETSLPIEAAFDFIADFANASAWDPGVASSERLDDGPVGLGSRYRLGVRMGGRVATMEYRITTFEAPTRVVLTGDGSNVHAVDEIRFAPTPRGGTAIDYRADIDLRGWMRPLAPFAGGAFQRIARDARDGMQRALEERSRHPEAA